MSRGDGFDLRGGPGAGRSGNGRETAFRPRLARIRQGDPHSFIGKVNKAVAKARAASGRTKFSGKSGRFNARGRGARIAAGLKGHGAWTVEPGSGSGPGRGMRFRARRVIVKARVVKLAGAGSRAAYAHLRYLQREGAGLERAEPPLREPPAPSFAAPSEGAAKREDGLEIAATLERAESATHAAQEIGSETGGAHEPPFSLAADADRAGRAGVEVERDGPAHAERPVGEGRQTETERERGALYSSFADDVDAKAFLKRGEHDRHQFRFIVSPEDGAELGDLRPFTRGLMRDLERDLGTHLDWVAVDHYDTGHPHTHIVVRGVTDDGK